MSIPKNAPAPRWTRLRGPVAAIAVAAVLGGAVVAPLAMPSAEADAETLAFEERIHQEFVPNESPEADLVFTEVPVELSEAAQQEAADKRAAKEAAKRAAEEAEASEGDEESGDGSSQESAPAAAPKYTGGGSPAEWMAAAGIDEDDWGYVDYVVSHESGWNPNATNASSGACGLVQALPCSKVPGNGYDPIDNLKWATGYAEGRYGGWKGAYDFWVSNSWW